MKDNPEKVFGNPFAIFVGTMLAIIVTVIGFLLLDQSLARYEYRQGIVEGYWHIGGSVGVGLTPTPRPNEQGAQSISIVSSSGSWRILVLNKTTGVKELVQCDREVPDFEKGKPIVYRQAVGQITGIEYGLPSC